MENTHTHTHFMWHLPPWLWNSTTAKALFWNCITDPLTSCLLALHSVLHTVAKLVFLKLKSSSVFPRIKILEEPLMSLINPLNLALHAFPASPDPYSRSLKLTVLLLLWMCISPLPGTLSPLSCFTWLYSCFSLSLLLLLIILANLYWVLAICQTLY